MTIVPFVMRMMVSAIGGVVLGSALQKLISHVQGDKKSRGQCVSYLLLQLLSISLIFYMAIRMHRTIDDWFTSTASGVLFSLAFFTVQSSLTTNTTCITA